MTYIYPSGGPQESRLVTNEFSQQVVRSFDEIFGAFVNLLTGLDFRRCYTNSLFVWNAELCRATCTALCVFLDFKRQSVK